MMKPNNYKLLLASLINRRYTTICYPTLKMHIYLCLVVKDRHIINDYIKWLTLMKTLTPKLKRKYNCKHQTYIVNIPRIYEVLAQVNSAE